MTQSFETIYRNDKISESLDKILNRDLTGVTLSSGTSFPQDITEKQIGRLCNRTDLKAIYTLTSVDPVEWKLVLDYSSEVATKPYVDENFQPISAILTMLATLTAGEDLLPYFTGNDSMSTLLLTSFSKSLLSASSAEEYRNLLGLGALATKDSIDGGSDDILDGSITEDKLAFSLVSENNTYSTGDYKESYNPVQEEGWLKHVDGRSIGSSSSGATLMTGSECQALYYSLWNLSSIVLQTSTGGTTTKGTSASNDWSANKRLLLPSIRARGFGSYIYWRL